MKLVEFPNKGTYAFAFLTAETPDVVREGVGESEGMITVFLPMAPNPVMGGYVLHVAEEHVFDVDMTVEEGIQSIVTSGVATGRRSQEEFTEGMLDRFERRLDAADVMIGIEELEETARETVAAARERATIDDVADGAGDGDGEAEKQGQNPE